MRRRQRGSGPAGRSSRAGCARASAAPPHRGAANRTHDGDEGRVVACAERDLDIGGVVGVAHHVGVKRTNLTPAATASLTFSRGPGGGGVGRRQRARTTSAPTNDTALMAKTAPGPAAAMRTPARAGPAALPTLTTTRLSAIATASCAAGTRSSMTAFEAGPVKAKPMQNTNIRPSSTGGRDHARQRGHRRSRRGQHHPRLGRQQQTPTVDHVGERSGEHADQHDRQVRRGRTSGTISGESVSEAMDQPAPTFCIHVPMFDASAAIHRSRNGRSRRDAAGPALYRPSRLASPTDWLGPAATRARHRGMALSTLRTPHAGGDEDDGA